MQNAGSFDYNGTEVFFDYTDGLYHIAGVDADFSTDKDAKEFIDATLAENDDNLEEDVFTEARLNFKSAGIERAPEYDFADDGNRFRGYICNGVPISYLKYDGDVYLTIRPDYLKGLTYDEYSKLPSYKDTHKYNGVPENSVDLEDVAKICKQVKDEYDAALGKIEEISDDEITDEFNDLYRIHKEYLEDIKEKLKEIDIWELSEYAISDIAKSLRYMQKNVNHYKELASTPSILDQSARRYRLSNYIKDASRKETYEYKHIMDIINKAKNTATESVNSDFINESKKDDIAYIAKVLDLDFENKLEEANNKVDLSKKEGTMSFVLENNIEKINAVKSTRELVTVLSTLFRENNIDTNASNRLITNVIKQNNLSSALYTVFNSILAGSGNSVISTKECKEAIYINNDRQPTEERQKISDIINDILYDNGLDNLIIRVGFLADDTVDNNKAEDNLIKNANKVNKAQANFVSVLTDLFFDEPVNESFENMNDVDKEKINDLQSISDLADKLALKYEDNNKLSRFLQHIIFEIDTFVANNYEDAFDVIDESVNQNDFNDKLKLIDYINDGLSGKFDFINDVDNPECFVATDNGFVDVNDNMILGAWVSSIYDEDGVEQKATVEELDDLVNNVIVPDITYNIEAFDAEDREDIFKDIDDNNYHVEAKYFDDSGMYRIVIYND